MNEIAAKVRIANVRPRQFRVTADALGAVGRDEWRAPTFISRDDIFRERDPAPGVLPAGARIAQDDAVTSMISWASSGAFGEGIGFFGYQYLSELTQRPEYRRPVEIIAKEMTRKWVRFVVAADKDKSDRVKKLEAAFKKYKVQELFARAAEQDGFFGIGHMFVDTGISDDRDALMTPLIRHKATIKKGSLNGFKIIEPLWTYPNGYNSDNPLRPDFYRPTSWFVMGKQVHSSRLLTFISREVPDILKPSYQFGGLSMTQLGKPYVDNWIRTRQSVSDLLHSFSTMVLATDMGVIMNAGAATDLVNRAMLFNQMRDNRGLMTINKDTEDLKNVSTPLSGLDKLQAQSQEHMSAVFGIPLVVLFGITPSGLNASSDSEIRVFYDWVHSQQEKLFRKNLLAVKEIIELSEFGDIDADISIEFEPLWQLDDAGLSAVQKTIADTHDIYLTQGVVSAEEVREVLGADEEGPYNGLDLSGPAPGPPEGASGADPSDPETNRIDEKGEEGSNSGALAGDKAFVESEHPRDTDGEFTSGGGAGAASAKGSKRTGLSETKIVDGKRVQANGSGLPDHITKLKIPPAWTDVRFAASPDADLLAVGKDSKGRVQSVYSAKFSATQAAAKFSRINELMQKFDEIVAQNNEARAAASKKTADTADCLDLIMKMGIRPGSETDTGAKVKAYGATTLEGRHVVKTDDGVSLQFVGKKGVSLNLPVADKALAEMLLERAENAGPDGKLFGAVTDKTLLDHTHSLDGHGFKTKDFRTRLGTATAYEIVRRMPAPKNEIEYKKAVMAVAKVVSEKLGNTPVIALQSYISPVVFSEWKQAS